MIKILITIASVLIVTAVVSVAYAQEADDGPIVTADPETPGFVPPVVGGAPPQPIIRFEFEGTPANLDISQFRGRDFKFNELPESAQRLFIQGLPSAERSNFENLPDSNDFQYEPRNPSSSGRPWDGLVSNWRRRTESFSVSRERGGTGYEPRGIVLPKIYKITWKYKF